VFFGFPSKEKELLKKIQQGLKKKITKNLTLHNIG